MADKRLALRKIALKLRNVLLIFEGFTFSSIISTVFSLLGLLILILLVKTFTLNPRTVQAPECRDSDSDFIPADPARIARFQQALRFETVSRAVGDQNYSELLKMQKYIIISFPTIHSSPLVTMEVISNYSLLYHVKGSDPALKPYMLVSHLDVVPALELDKWEAPPFSGNIVNGFIYGRGTIDDKHQLMSILEAVEYMLKHGYKPKRTIYMAFGHDEEINGQEGAKAIGKVLGSRGVELEYLIDEGLVIVQNIIPGIDKPVALVGTSEKGFLTLSLNVNITGGHSSMPTKESSIGILAQAITRLEMNPQPSMFGRGPELGMFEHIAPDMNFIFRVVMSNLWLFGPLVSRILSRKPQSNAMVRTTTAITEFHAGIKSNILAPTATATINHRIHPSQTIEQVIEYDRMVINDERVKIRIGEKSQKPLPLSPYGDDVFGYQMIKTSIRQVWNYRQVVVAPGLMIGGTDTKHYTQLTQNIYRFGPALFYPEDTARFHGMNERISVKNYQEAINFYYHLIRNSDKSELEPQHSHGDL